jgi:hypothetical protein
MGDKARRGLLPQGNIDVRVALVVKSDQLVAPIRPGGEK